MRDTRYKIQDTRYKRAFTLVEALVALSILIVGIISGFILVTKALYDVTIIQDRLTASFLAQEGLELVRQIRDTNYFKTLGGNPTTWDNNLANGNYIISARTNPPPIKVELQPLTGTQYLYYHPDTRLYNYESFGGQLTSFQRTINIYHVSSDEIRVQAIMSWKTRNISFGFTSEDHLFNWLKI
jgi:type II secretory pathway pseudopilin PulG